MTSTIINSSLNNKADTSLYSADTIGEFFLHWAKEEYDIGIKKTKLNKLVAYAQVHYIHETGKPLFADKNMEAWKYGPVIVDLCGVNKETQGDIKPSNNFTWNDIAESDGDFLVKIWNTYGKISSEGLVELSHHEDFWKDVYNSDNENALISIDLITALYHRK